MIRYKPYPSVSDFSKRRQLSSIINERITDTFVASLVWLTIH